MNTENNKLIAKFLGWKEQTDPTEKWFTQFFNQHGERKGGTNKEPLLFHSDWNWLMEVVFKCLEICNNEMLNEWEDSFSGAFFSMDIVQMYEEAISFIKWYNSTKH